MHTLNHRSFNQTTQTKKTTTKKIINQLKYLQGHIRVQKSRALWCWWWPLKLCIQYWVRKSARHWARRGCRWLRWQRWWRRCLNAPWKPKSSNMSNEKSGILNRRGTQFDRHHFVDINPIKSMYGIFTNMYHENQPNVDEYTIHGSYGNIYEAPVWIKYTSNIRF